MFTRLLRVFAPSPLMIALDVLVLNGLPVPLADTVKLSAPDSLVVVILIAPVVLSMLAIAFAGAKAALSWLRVEI